VTAVGISDRAPLDPDPVPDAMVVAAGVPPAMRRLAERLNRRTSLPYLSGDDHSVLTT